MFRSLLFTCISLSLAVVQVAADPVCACCLETGYRYSANERLDAASLELLRTVRFGSTAELYMSAAGFDAFRGLRALEAKSETEFTVKGTLVNRIWNLSFRTPSGQTGAFTLPLPATVRKYYVDTRDEEFKDRGLGPSVYKELTFTGTIRSANGVFSSASGASTKYTLVLQGRGNGCDDASDFRHWQLDVTGPRADFTVLGAFDVTPRN